MALPHTAQVLYDYIQANPNLREFWEGYVDEIRREKVIEKEQVDELIRRLMLVYLNPENTEDLQGSLDQVDLFGLDWHSLAYKLRGTDLQDEAMRHWPQSFRDSGWDVPEEYFKKAPVVPPPAGRGGFVHVTPVFPEDDPKSPYFNAEKAARKSREFTEQLKRLEKPSMLDKLKGCVYSIVLILFILWIFSQLFF